MRKDGFTILEFLVAIAILSFLLLSVFMTFRTISSLVQRSQYQIVANNLSREAVEMIRNIRDSNREINKDQKDKCWLIKDPLGSNGNKILLASNNRILLTQFGPILCETKTWISSGWYTVSSKTNVYDQKYFYMSGINIDAFDNQEDVLLSSGSTQLCNDDGIWDLCDVANQDLPLVFRAVNVSGLFEKESNLTGGTAIDCNNGAEVNCGSNSPKELRFCVHTWLMGSQTVSSKICSSLTNREG